MINKLSIIIPVYNEENTIEELLQKVVNVKLINSISKEIIVVDDASRDNCEAIIERFIDKTAGEKMVFVKHSVNQGKGGAIHTGIKHATGDYIIMQDADLELNPEEYNDLFVPIIRGEADVVYGSRFINRGKQGGSFISRLANLFLTLLTNIVLRIRITDMETCYKLIKADTIKSIDLKEKRFGFEPEITAKLARDRKNRFAEVPITYMARSQEQGKKIGWRDGFRAVYCIIKYGWFS